MPPERLPISRTYFSSTPPPRACLWGDSISPSRRRRVTADSEFSRARGGSCTRRAVSARLRPEGPARFGKFRLWVIASPMIVLVRTCKRVPAPGFAGDEARTEKRIVPSWKRIEDVSRMHSGTSLEAALQDDKFATSTVARRASLEENAGVRTAPGLVGWAIALAAVTLVAGALVLDEIAAARHVQGSGSVWLYPWQFAAILTPAAVGALIAAQRPRNPIGWILVVGALSLAAVLTAVPYAWVALDGNPRTLPGGSWAALVSSLWPAFFAW